MAEQADPNALIVEAATGVRELTEAELQFVLEHVAQVGFDPNALERVRGRLAGVEWNGRILKGSDLLPPAETHYLRHTVAVQEWPPGTTLQGYLDSIEQVILDVSSGVLTSMYSGVLQLTVMRRTQQLRGSGGADWVVVDYRVETGHWVTAFQPQAGLGELRSPNRSNVLWLRQPQ